MRLPLLAPPLLACVVTDHSHTEQSGVGGFGGVGGVGEDVAFSTRLPLPAPPPLERFLLACVAIVLILWLLIIHIQSKVESGDSEESERMSLFR